MSRDEGWAGQTDPGGNSGRCGWEDGEKLPYGGDAGAECRGGQVVGAGRAQIPHRDGDRADTTGLHPRRNASS